MAYLYEQSDLYILLETSKTEVKEGERVTFDIVLYDSNGYSTPKCQDNFF